MLKVKRACPVRVSVPTSPRNRPIESDTMPRIGLAPSSAPTVRNATIISAK
jgi:hypothetical protein